jgi:hypothetical protein
MHIKIALDVTNASALSLLWLSTHQAPLMTPDSLFLLTNKSLEVPSV